MQTEATLFALFEGATKKSEQSNNPVFTETTSPSPGYPWTWLVSNIQGFAGGASFDFTPTNADGTEAELTWSLIEDSDWTKVGGCDGTVDLLLTNGYDMDISYPGFQISLRHLDCGGLTLFSGQTGGGSPLPSGDAGPYTFTAPLFAGGLPGDLDLEFDSGSSGRGVVTNVTSASAGWTESGTATLRIQDGTKPYSELTGVAVKLRELEETGYTLFSGQTGGGSPLPSGDAGPYTFTAPLFAGGLPGDLDLEFDSGSSGRGVVTNVTSASAGWTESGTATLRIQDGTLPYSDVPGIAVDLRKLGHAVYYWFDNQTSASPTSISAAGADGSYAWSKTEGSVTVTPSGTGNIDATITSASGSSGTDTTFDLTITDGTRPDSVVSIELRRRHVDPDPSSISWIAGSGSEPVSVQGGTAISWTWGTGTFNMNESSVLTFPTATTGTTANIEWGDNGLDVDGDSGTLDFTIEPDDGSAPQCSIRIGINVLDTIAPVPELSTDATGTVNSAFTVEVETHVESLSPLVSWFTCVDCSITSGITLKDSSTSLTLFTMEVTPDLGVEGSVTVTLDAGSYDDGVNDNTDSNNLSVTADTKFEVYAYPGTTIDIPNARENMRYQVVLWADTTVPAGSALSWSIDDPDIAAVMELVDDPVAPVANQKILQTKVAGSNITYIPGDSDPTPWGGATKTIPITATLNDGTKDVAEGEQSFSLVVEDTKSNIDVAVLIDRSGSMGGDRWRAAMEGAAIFANLVSEICNVTPGAGVWTTTPHRAGLYWFWGNNYWGGSNYPNPASDPSGYDGGYHNCFEDEDGDTYQLPDGAALAKPDKISDDPDDGTLVDTINPGHCTAMSSGLLHCRKDLQDNDTGNNEKVILVLSDGMENRGPKVDEVFLAADPLWFHKEGDDGEPAEDPNIRIYANAVLTGASWADKLRDVVEATGGVRALDVKHITDYTDYTDQIVKWFVTSFKRLFGFIAPDEIPDPTIGSGEWREHPVTVNLGNDKAVFYALFGDGDAQAWDFGIVPPGQGGAIYASRAELYPGIRCVSGTMFKMMIVDLPLEMAGHGHRWAGEWKMIVSREGQGSGSYSVGALVHQDMGTRVEIIAPPRPKPGVVARIRAVVKDQAGRPVKDATVSTLVHRPGPWPGNEVALEVGSNLELVKELARSRSQENRDMESVSDRVLRRMQEEGQLKGGKKARVKLAHVKNGIYEAEVKLSNPGDHDFDTTIEGVRKTPRKEIKAKIGKFEKDLGLYYPASIVKDEKAYLKTQSGTKQAFKVEDRQQLSVGFVPTVKDSETGGYFVDDTTIRLLVQPAGKGDAMLGPGWADSITFRGPDGVDCDWAAIDEGDGDYRVDIPFKAVDPITDLSGRSITAAHMTLHHPVRGAISPRDNTLPLEGFEAVVLGVELPISVWALVGNSRSKQVHLITCPYAAKIRKANEVWLHDLEQAKHLGYDTCEHCLPLICNTDPDHMEAHKPFCSHVRRIALKNRLEVHGWSQAEKLGFDGCHYCMPRYHEK